MQPSRDIKLYQLTSLSSSIPKTCVGGKGKIRREDSTEIISL